MSDLRDKVIAAMLEAAAQRGDRERVAYYEEADAAIAVVLEEAAKAVGAMPRTHTKIKEDHDVLGMTGTWTFTLNNGPTECAATIRALKGASDVQQT